MHIGTNQRVGIGNTSPQKILDVTGDALINGLTIGRGAANDPSNTAIGAGALANHTGTTDYANVAIGNNALASNTTGFNNTGVGRFALYAVTTGTQNTALGTQALFNATGTGNIAIGSQAGINETGSNKLYIANNSVNNLIHGDFSTGQVQINAAATPSLSSGIAFEVIGYARATAYETQAGVRWTSGTGSPESVVTASVGSMYTRTDGGAGTTLYVKESGSGNTGWVAK